MISEECLHPQFGSGRFLDNASFQIHGPFAKRRATFVRFLHEAQPHAGSLLADASDEVRSEVLHKAFASSLSDFQSSALLVG